MFRHFCEINLLVNVRVKCVFLHQCASLIRSVGGGGGIWLCAQATLTDFIAETSFTGTRVIITLVEKPGLFKLKWSVTITT